MTLAFFSVILNNHQAPLADELYKILGDDFVFVETCNLFGDDKKGSTEDFSGRSYWLKAWQDDALSNKAIEIAKTFDVCIFDGAFNYQKIRMTTGKLSFNFSEHWLKSHKNLFSYRAWLKIFTYHINHWSKKPLYKLCASAYAASDMNKVGMFKNKCYKFGYFTAPAKEIFITRTCDTFTIMWCARFIDWKHPELVIELARKLSESHDNYIVNMYGDGPLKINVSKLINKYNLNDKVIMHGNVPNDVILRKMKLSDLFLFTSDKNEGWGAVANEAMSNGCCILASDKIGCIPYLVHDGDNGFVFKNCDSQSLYEKTKYLIDNPEIRKKAAKNGMNDLRTIWSPKNAAYSLIQLSTDLLAGRDTSIVTGPCSKA